MSIDIGLGDHVRSFEDLDFDLHKFLSRANASSQMKIVTVAVYALLLWDMILTMHLEIRHVYRSRLSLVKVLWFLNRIGAPITIGVHCLNAFASRPSTTFCTTTGATATYMSIVNVFVIQASLCLRVAALYQRSTWVMAFMCFLIMGSTSARITIFALNPIKHMPSPLNIPHSGCWAFPDNQIAGAYLSTLILDTALFIMTVARMGTGLPDRANLKRTSILVLFFRDGSLYYLAVVVAVSLTVAGYYHSTTLGPALSSSYLFLGIMSTACSRLLLNLREAASPPPITLSTFNGPDVILLSFPMALVQSLDSPGITQ